MGAVDKGYEQRMAGMNHAYDVVKEGGIEAIEKEIRMRGITKLVLNCRTEFVQKQWREITENCYNNMITCVLYTLHENYGFGKERLTSFKRHYDENVKNAVDLDYMGEHYVTLSDYARELNENYDLSINANLIDITQGRYDDKDENYHVAKIEKVIELMERKGETSAAEILRGLINDI